MDTTIQQDLLEREQIITSTRERGFYAIAIATTLMLLVIVAQILVIRKDSRKKYYDSGQLEFDFMEDKRREEKMIKAKEKFSTYYLSLLQR